MDPEKLKKVKQKFRDYIVNEDGYNNFGHTGCKFRTTQLEDSELGKYSLMESKAIGYRNGNVSRRLTTTEEMKFISVDPMSDSFSSFTLGACININKINKNGCRFLDALKGENFNTTVKENVRGISDFKLDLNFEERAKMLMRDVGISFNFDSILTLNGSTYLENKSGSSNHSVTNTFYFSDLNNVETLVVDDIDIHDFIMDHKSFTHMITRLYYGKALNGHMKVTLSDEYSSNEAKDELKFDVKNFFIKESNAVMEKSSSELDNKYHFEASLASIGVEQSGSLGSAAEIADFLKQYAELKDSDGIIGYEITPLSAYPHLAKDLPPNPIGEFLRSKIMKRVLQLHMFVYELSNESTEHALVPHDITDQERVKYKFQIKKTIQYIEDYTEKIIQAVRTKRVEDCENLLAETFAMSVEFFRTMEPGKEDDSISDLNLLINKYLAQAPKHYEDAKDVSISDNGIHIWVVNKKGKLYYKNLHSEDWQFHDVQVNKVSVSPDGSIVWKIDKNGVNRISYGRHTDEKFEEIKWSTPRWGGTEIAAGHYGFPLWIINRHRDAYVVKKLGDKKAVPQPNKKFINIAVTADGKDALALSLGGLIYHKKENKTWRKWKKHIALRNISVSNNMQHIWGTNKDDEVFHKENTVNSATFVQVSGKKMKKVVVDSTGSFVVGIGMDYKLYKRTKDVWKNI